MLQRFRALPTRSRIWLGLGGLVALAALAFVVAYGYLVVSTANAPRGARLGETPSAPASTAGPTSGAAPSAAASSQFQGAEGSWVVASNDPGFVGYRAREILGVEFFRAPNDAVGRTSAISGELQVHGTQLVRARITAAVEQLKSDEQPRDMHIIEYLGLREHPEAIFELTDPVEIGTPVRGRVVDVTAQGQLTILDVSRMVIFPLHARWDGDAIQVAGQMSIRRSDYHMDVGQLLGFRVADDITIELELRFVRPCDPCTADSPGSGSPSPSSAAPIATSTPAAPSITPDKPARTAANPPGGGAIAFVGIFDRGQSGPPDSQVYVLGPTGAPRPLTKSTEMLGEPAWSRGGRLIAYTSASEEAPPRIWVMNGDGSGARQVNRERDLRSPDWSPDGRSIVCIPAFEQRGQLLVVDVRSGAIRMILEEQGGIDETPDWSPDGRRIVFGRFPRASSNQDLWLINPDGSGLRRLTSDPGYEYSPDWSPDGRRIAFIREGDVWTIGADGRNARRLTRGLKADSPAWSRDGRRIAFTVEKELWVMNADGSDKTRIQLPFTTVANPVWRPR